MKILFVHAHFDDYEFTAAGTFERWRRQLGSALRARVIVCTDGRGGHHVRTRAETGRIRLGEQRESARLGGYEFELLRYPDGTVPREGCLTVDGRLLAGLWKAIRDFEPDYLFCPPLPVDPLAGVHVDHLAVAEAVRKVAYLINVPHAFTPEYPADERRSKPCRVPVILTTYDGYMHGANAFDLAVDVTPVFDTICALTWCHQSQIREWIPWVGRHQLERGPESREEWAVALRKRFVRQQRDLGIRTRKLVEVFTVTAWGEVARIDSLIRDLPGVLKSASHMPRLRARLRRWQGG
jgi:LmbE family N-acetylglucosaminyl deacetylase